MHGDLYTRPRNDAHNNGSLKLYCALTALSIARQPSLIAVPVLRQSTAAFLVTSSMGSGHSKDQDMGKWHPASAWSLSGWGGDIKRTKTDPERFVITYSSRESAQAMASLMMMSSGLGHSGGKEFFHFILPDAAAYSHALATWANKPERSRDICLDGFEFLKVKEEGYKVCHRVHLLRRVGTAVSPQQLQVFQQVREEAGGKATVDVLKYALKNFIKG